MNNKFYKDYFKNPEQEFKIAFDENNYDNMKILFNHKKLNKETVVSCLLVAIKGNEKDVAMFLWKEYFNNSKFDTGQSMSLCIGSWVFNYLTPYNLSILIPWIIETEPKANNFLDILPTSDIIKV